MFGNGHHVLEMFYCLIFCMCGARLPLCRFYFFAAVCDSDGNELTGAAPRQQVWREHSYFVSIHTTIVEIKSQHFPVR